MKSFSYNLNSFFVAFADTWQSCVIYTYCIKTALIEILWERTITQISLLPPDFRELQEWFSELQEDWNTEQHQTGLNSLLIKHRISAGWAFWSLRVSYQAESITNEIMLLYL